MNDTSITIDLIAQTPNSAFLAGGTNLVNHMKPGVAQPEMHVNITGLLYAQIEQLPAGGLRIGAMVRNGASFLMRRLPWLCLALSGALTRECAAMTKAISHTTGSRVRDLP